MRKQFLFLLIILLIFSTSTAFAGNNTTPVDNPTITIADKPTIKAIESGDSNISFEQGYRGYCAEWGEHSAEEGQIFYIEDSTKINNSNYLKTMFLFFYNQTQKDIYATQHMIWKFTDNKQFSRFNQTWYNQIIETGNKYTIPDDGIIPINKTHQFNFSFKAFIAQINEYQNYFTYKFFIDQIPDNSTIQINNSTTNNSTTIIPNYINNNTHIQYNNINEKNSIINSSTYTLNNIKTGISLWTLGCVILMLTIIFIFKYMRHSSE